MASRSLGIIDNRIRGAATLRALRFGARSLLRRAAATLRLWSQRSRQRHALRRLDDRLLADIGLTPDDADRICATPFWRSTLDPTAEARRRRP